MFPFGSIFPIGTLSEMIGIEAIAVYYAKLRSQDGNPVYLRYCAPWQRARPLSARANKGGCAGQSQSELKG
jgi:hypothetical protein